MKHTKGIVFLGSCLILFISSFINAPADNNKSLADTFDHGLFSYYQDNQATGLDDIIGDFNLQQLQYIQIAPPNEEFCWTQDGELTLFNPAGFPREFVTGLVSVNSEGIITYPILVVEDSATRQAIFYNAKSEKIAAVAPRPDYNPDWILLNINPLLYYSGLSYEEIASSLRLYNPARLMVRYNLILRNDLVKHVLKTSILEEKREKDAELGIGIMRAYVGAPVTNIVFTDIEKLTNGIRLTVAYPFNLSTYPTNCYTNKLEFFSCADLVDGYFTSLAVTNVSSATNWIEWTDVNSSIYAADYRYYAAGNADKDSDSDSLTDAREKFMYHTSPTNSDTDADGYSDYQEVIVLYTDPNNNDTNRPVVMLDLPINNTERIWTP